MTTNVGGVEIDIKGNNRDFKRKMRESEQAARRGSLTMRTSLNDTSRSALFLNQRISGVTSAFTVMAAAGAIALGAQGVGIIKEYGQAMSTLEGITRATADQMVQLDAKAKLLGSTTRFSATQAAEGMTFLARAGFSVEEALSAIEPALNLAQAGNLDLGRAADIASNVLSGFNKPATEAAEVMDKLAFAANNSNTDINQLGEALKFAAPTAVALGLSIEETVAAVGKLSDAGIQAGLAGRGFQSFATQLVNNKKQIEGLIGTYDVAEEGLAGIVKRLSEAGITTEQVIKTFRAENLDVWTVLANSVNAADGSLTDFAEALKAVDGESKRVAQTMDDNLNGAILAARSALEGFILAIGDAGATAALRGTFEALASLLRIATQNMDLLTIAAIALLTRALIPLAVSGITAVGSAMTFMIAQANLATLAFGRIGAAARVGALALGVFGGPVTLAIAAAATAIFVLNNNMKDAESTADKLKTAHEKQLLALQAISNLKGDDGKSIFKSMADDLRDASGAAADFVEELEGVGKGIAAVLKLESVQASFAIQDSINANQIALAALEKDRSDAARRAEGVQTARGFIPGDGGEALRRFEEENGSEITRLTQVIAISQNRLKQTVPAWEDVIKAYKGAGEDVEKAGKIVRQSAEDLAKANAKAAETRREDTAAKLAENKANSLGEFSETVFGDALNIGDGAGPLQGDTFGTQDIIDAEAKKLEDAKKTSKAFADDIESLTRIALKQAVISGDWQSAFQTAIQGAVASGFEKAIDNAIDVLFDAFKNFNGGGIGGAIGNIFGGAKASGGKVFAGTSYTVGELGPETFIPAVDGFIAPNGDVSNGIASAASAGAMPGSVIVNAPFIVQGSITDDTVDIVREHIGEFAKQVPLMVRAENQRGRQRGR